MRAKLDRQNTGSSRGKNAECAWDNEQSWKGCGLRPDSAPPVPQERGSR